MSQHQRLTRLHVLLRSGRAAKACYAASELERGATLDIYAHTSFVMIRRMIEAHLSPTWKEAVRSALNTGGSVELFLASLNDRIFTLDETVLDPHDSLISKGLGHVEQIHAVLFVESAPVNQFNPALGSSTSSSIGRSGRLSLHESSPQAASPSPSSLSECSVMFVRVVGSIIPKAVRMVLECNPNSFVENLFAALEAKLVQLGVHLRRSLTSVTHAFFLFVLVGVGTGKAGRRVEPLERLQHLVESGCNVLTLCLREHVIEPAVVHHTTKEEACGRRRSPSTDLRQFFVASSTWDAIEPTPQLCASSPAIVADTADAHENDVGATAVNSADRECSAATWMHVQLDLPAVVEDVDDDCDPEGNRLHVFSIDAPAQHRNVKAPKSLEDELELLSSSSDDDLWPRMDVEEPSSTTAHWQDLPFTFLTIIGSGCPARYVENSLEADSTGSASPLVYGAQSLPSMRFLMPDVETIVRDLREDEIILSFDLTEDLTAKSMSVLDAHQPEITHEQLRGILATMEVDYSPADDLMSCMSNASGNSDDYLDRDWDVEDVATVCAHSESREPSIGATCRSRTAKLEADCAPSTSCSPLVLGLNGPASTAHPPLTQWPGLCALQPPTPTELHQPLDVSYAVAQRHTHSERQHEFFRQQALAPLMSEHRRIHQSKVDVSPPKNTVPSQRVPREAAMKPHSTTTPLLSSSTTRSPKGALPLLSSSPQPAKRQHPHHYLERMNVVASIYRPPESSSHSPVCVSRSVPVALPAIQRAPHSSLVSQEASRLLAQSQNLRSGTSFGASFGAQRETNPHDVFSFLSHTLRSIHDDATILPDDQHSVDGSHGQLDLLRSAAVATYTQRLLLEHRDLSQRAAELARMFQASPATSQSPFGSSQRLYQQRPARFGPP